MSMNLVSGIYELKQAKEHFEVFRIDCGAESKGDKLAKKYIQMIDWMMQDVITHPFLPENVREGFRRERSADSFQVDAIKEKVLQLAPQQREAIEVMIDYLLAGGTLNVESTETKYDADVKAED